jgi:hypothetical protein
MNDIALFSYITFGLFILAFIWDEFIGVSLLLIALYLGDRNFAYISVSFHGFTVFIVEFCLAIWLLRILLLKPSALPRAWRLLPMPVRICWSGLLLTGCLSFMRGALSYPLSAVLRDSMLVNYSIAAFLFFVLDVTTKRLWILLRLLGLCAVLKAIIALIGLFAKGTSFIPLFSGQPAAVSILSTLPIIFYLALCEMRWLNPLEWIQGVILLTNVLVLEVRSSWLGFLIAYLALLCWEIGLRPEPLKRIKIISGNGLLIGAGAVVMLFILSTPKFNAVRPHQTESTSIATATVQTSIMATAKTISSTGGEPPMRAKKTFVLYGRDQSTNEEKIEPILKSVHPAPVQALLSASISEPPTFMSSVGKEFRTFKMGTQSDNVMTRLWMWQDALMELCSIGPYGRIKLEDLNHYNVVWDLNRSTNRELWVPVSGAGIQKEKQVIRLSLPGDPPLTLKEKAAVGFKMFFGVPFGKYYLPVQIVWRVNSPHRYDPHNSLVAILYRTGFIGFLFFIGFNIAVLRSGMKFLRENTDIHSRLVLASMSCVVFVIGHALTDNVLENSFKGLWYWFLIALALKIMTCSQTPVDPKH